MAAPAAWPRVFVFGIDGGSWPLIDHGIAAGELPAFAALAARGVTAEMETVEPVISPVVWTSIATGRAPEVHGVTDFFRNRTHVRVPTVFERLAQRGLRVGLYEWLVTWPPRPLPGGFMIPDWLRRDERTAPPDVFARAGLTPYVYAVDRYKSLDGYAENARREVAEKPGRFLALVDTYRLDVAAVGFYSVDATGHRFWRAQFPQEFGEPPSAAEARHPNVIRDTLRGVDGALGQVVASLGPDDAIVVVSDHGFQAGSPRRVWSLRLREQLAAAGLDAARDGFEIDGEFFATLVRVLPGPFDRREATLERLRALLESARTEDGQPLLEVDVIDVAERPPEARRSLLQRLRQWVVARALDWGYGVRLDRPAYACLLAQPADEALMGIWPDGVARLGDRPVPVSTLFQVDEFTGDHHPTAIFLAAGGPIAHAPVRGRLSVLDVAPLLFHVAGSPIPDDLEGRVPEFALDPATLAARPVLVVPAAELSGLPPAPAEAEIDDAVLMERLRALGYVR